MPDTYAVIGRTVNDNRQACIRLVQDLIRTSKDGEQAAQQCVAEQISSFGCTVATFSYTPRDLAQAREFVAPASVDPSERTIVVGQIVSGARGRSLILFAHPDVETVTGLDAGRRGPFAGEIENGRLYGWGVADNLSGVAAMICALKAVLTAGLRPKGSVTLVSMPSKRHARGMAAVLERGYSADAAVYLHPAESGAGLREIKAATAGLLRFQVHIEGRPADTHEPEHTPFHHLAVNPIDRARILIGALKALDKRRAGSVRHPAMDAAIGRSTNLQIGYIHGGDPARLHHVSPTCVLAGSVTFPPTERMADVQSQIAKAVAAAAARDTWLKQHPPALEWLLGVPGAEIALDHPIYRAVSGVIGAVTGVEPKANPLHAASDIRHPILHGIPSVGIGPRAGDFTQAAGTNEWVDIVEYIQTIEVAARVIVDWCGVQAPGA